MSLDAYPPDSLWSASSATAELNTNWGDDGAYVQGYFDAARHLADQMANKRLSPDIMVYPALYLLRHSLELAFKALLRGYSFELEMSPPLGGKGHSLGKLWTQLRPLLAKGDWRAYLEPGGRGSSVTLDYIDEVVVVIDAADPTGEAARYDADNKGERTLRGIRRVNLLVLSELCDLCGEWAVGLIDGREALLSGLRVDRWARTEAGAKALAAVGLDPGDEDEVSS